jgi:hypothetical protein
MIRGRELLWRLLAAARTLAPEISAQGGLLKVGVFSSDLHVNDVAGKARAAGATMAAHQWLRDLFAVPPEVYVGLERVATALGRLPVPQHGAGGSEAVGGSLLHLKANFFASREAWTLLARPEWESMIEEFAQLRMAEAHRPSAAIGSFEDHEDPLRDLGGEVPQRWYDALPATTRERVVFFTVLGSANQNDRSFALDGEDALVMSRWPSVVAYLDLITLVGQSHWIEDPAALDGFLPAHSGLKTRLGHWFRLAF